MAVRKIATLSPASKVLLSLSCVFVVGLAAYNWTVGPQTSYLKAARLYEVMMGDAGRMTKTITDRMVSKTITAKKLNEEITRIQDGFFTPKQVNEFFLDLEPIAHQCNCTVQKLVFIPSDPILHEGRKNDSYDITVKRSALSLQGCYADIIRFMRRLSNYSQRIIIDSLAVENSDVITGDLACHMTITIYVIKDKELGIDE